MPSVASSQIIRSEVDRTPVPPLWPRSLAVAAQLGTIFACNIHHFVAGFRQAAADAQPDTTASAGDDDVTHENEPAFLFPRWVTRAQS